MACEAYTKADEHHCAAGHSLCKRSYCRIINVGHKARAVIEKLVAAGIIALEILFPERYAVRPLWVLKDLHGFPISVGISQM